MPSWLAHEHGLSSEAIRDAPEDGPAHELTQRKDGEQEAHLGRRGAEVLRVVGKERQHQRQREHVDEDRQVIGTSARVVEKRQPP